MKNAFIKHLTFICALLMLGVFGAPVCYAYFRPPPVTDIATLDEFEKWYRLPEAGLALLTSDIEITQSLKLEPTTQTKGVQAYNWGTSRGYTLRVMQGATLIVDNPQMELSGVKEIITVENGGTLLLKRGTLMAGTEDNKSVVAIVVKKGGNITVENGFKLANGVVENENPQIPETPAPPETTPPPDTRNPITSIFDDKAHISCLAGEHPAASQYLDTVYAYFKSATFGAEIPVEWDISAVDFSKAGTYTVVGTLTDAGMKKHNLSNPQNLKAKMTITVYKRGAMNNVSGEFLSVSSQGNTISKIILPTMPLEKIGAIYIYKSADNRVWEQATRDLFPVNGVIPTSEDFLPAVTTVGAKSYIPFYYKTDYNPLWVRVEVVGSDLAGMSNAIKLKLPIGTKPGDSVQQGGSGNDGSSGGNRGGVGQNVTIRVMPDEDAPSKTSPPPSANQQINATGGVAKSRTDTATSGEATDKATDETPEKTADIPLDEATADEAIATMGAVDVTPTAVSGSSTKPKIPGAVTAAVCTVVAISTASVLLKFNWHAILKLIKRKP